MKIKDDRPVKFNTILTINMMGGHAELQTCTRCGATVILMSKVNGDMLVRVHEKWHQEQGH